MPSRDRVGLLKLMWDLVGTEFAGRQLQYEMFYSAAQHVADLHVFRVIRLGGRPATRSPRAGPVLSRLDAPQPRDRGG